MKQTINGRECDIADTLMSDNPRFDRARFYAACGLED